MINYFHKIAQFEIDSKKLYDEWITVANKHDMFNRTEKFVNKKISPLPFYYKLLINYPSSMNEHMDPVWIQYCENNQGGNVHLLYRVDNIIKNFKGTYTEEIVKKVASWLNNKYPKHQLTVIKYAALGPKSAMGTHVDPKTVPRFFLSVSASIGSYMEICNEKHPLHETGALFKMMCDAPHNPINESDDYRLMMIFDVADT